MLSEVSWAAEVSRSVLQKGFSINLVLGDYIPISQSLISSVYPIAHTYPHKSNINLEYVLVNEIPGLFLNLLFCGTIVLVFPPQSFEKADGSLDLVAFILDCDLEDSTPLEMSGMTLLLGMVTAANIAAEPLINSISRFSSAVKTCPEKFQTEGTDEGW